MSMLVTLLRINSFLFITFGFGFLLKPVVLATFATGEAPHLATAIIDMRATYGGMALGFGIFLAWCGLNRQAVREGSVALMLLLFGLALGRLVGIALDGDPNVMTFAMLFAEFSFGVLVAIALTRAEK